MDLPNILNSKGSAKAAQAAVEQQLQHQLVQAAQANGRAMSAPGLERGLSPHISDQSNYMAHPNQPLHNIANLSNTARYNAPVQGLSMIPGPYLSPNGGIENGFPHPQPHNDQHGDSSNNRSSEAGGAPKAFACNNCGKGFARRSDLARHERIHSGLRPHICDHPACGKQFIQRSALTVHARVHTGEKPHMCEHCTKPFSDSSSLARHRRIHSGKRPYKCPFADCQKTFTRRTTLTRHQNHHTGTVEEAAAATAAALASRTPGRPTTQSVGGFNSDTGGSANSTPSPGERTMSLSPSSEVTAMPLLPRQHSDFAYMPTGSLPPHLRGDLHHQQQQQLHHQSPRSSPTSTSPSLSAYGGGGPHRPSMTSHPSMYGPPPTLEPPTHHDMRQTTNNANGSPHLSNMGWQSPSQHGGMGSPTHGEAYIYPEPPYGQPAPHLYYPNSSIRRPQSTEPDQYETKRRMMSGEVWSGQM